MTVETKLHNTPQGIYTHLESHSRGHRSRDQFCLYVADRLVLPTLSQDDIVTITSGRRQMDAAVDAVASSPVNHSTIESRITAAFGNKSAHRRRITRLCWPEPSAVHQ
jgi:hypothetical protein